MPQVTGRVQRIMNRGKAFNIQMDDGEYYGYGFNAPNFGEGAEIGFDVQYNGQYKNVIVESVQVYNGGQQPQQQQGGGGYQNRGQGGGRGNGGGGNYNRRGGGGRGGNNNAKDAYWKEKERKDEVKDKGIRYQAARNAAIAVVDVCLKNDCLSLPAKKGDRLDAVLAVVDEITERFDFATDAVRIAAEGGNQNAPEPNNVQDDMGYNNGGYQE